MLVDVMLGIIAAALVVMAGCIAAAMYVMTRRHGDRPVMVIQSGQDAWEAGCAEWADETRAYREADVPVLDEVLLEICREETGRLHRRR